MSKELAGRVILVAGASSGIGRATAQTLHERGAVVHALARRAPDVGGVIGHAVDVTDRAALQAALAPVAAIGAVVYCAGTNVPQRRLGELAPEDWDRLVETNLTGAFNVVQATLARLRASRGDLVITSSVSSRWPDASGPAYQAAKGGLTSFAQAVALEERERGVRVCAIEPGMVDTPLLERRPVPPDAATRERMLRPEDVADVIAYVLALPERVAIPSLVILPAALQTLGRT